MNINNLKKLLAGLIVLITAISGYVNAQARSDNYETIIGYYDNSGKKLLGEKWTDCHGSVRTWGHETINVKMKHSDCGNPQLP